MGGFSAVLGNPPFLGGQKLTGTFGDSFRDYLVQVVSNGEKGSIDLCTYFLIKTSQINHHRGNIAIVGTNSISQGNNEQLGLKRLMLKGYQITSALTNIVWAGDASVIVHCISISKNDYPSYLNGERVEKIGSNLEESLGVDWEPQPLSENKNCSFQGSILVGKGFFISEDLAQQFLVDTEKNLEVIRRHIGGKDLNNSPEQQGSRWVIDFGNMDYEKAKSFVEPFRHIESHVKPERQRINPKTGKHALSPRQVEFYWQYTRPRPQLYSQTRGKKERVLAIAQVSNTAQVAFVSPNDVLDAKLVVFDFDDFFHYGVMSSSIHLAWCFARCTTMKNDFTYTPNRLFEPFPFPNINDNVKQIAKTLDEKRCKVMVNEEIGLTKLYNKIHDLKCTQSEIIELRKIHSELDYAVLSAYGWDDVSLQHDFNETGQGIRYFPSKKASREILTRLTLLNKQKIENGG